VQAQKCAAEKDEVLRDAWVCKLTEFTAKQLLFLDESAANERTSDRKYGWGPIGVTPHLYQPLKRTERWSILPVYTIDGFLTWEIMQAGFDKQSFNDFVRNQVLPYCNPFPGLRSVLVMDNCKIHHSEVHNIQPVSANIARSLRKCVKMLEYA